MSGVVHPVVVAAHHQGMTPSDVEPPVASPAGTAADPREVEPYRGVRALFNADLSSYCPDYAPRQEWLVVRRPAGAGGWDEDHLTAIERAAAQLVRDAEERTLAAEAEASRRCVPTWRPPRPTWPTPPA